MRIVGGAFRGRTLYGFTGEDIRPTSDNARESLFNILGDINGKTFLDLFAGTGAVGIEALSRGAKADFNDMSRDSVSLVKKNSELFGINPFINFGDALSFISSTRKKYDIIFCDPPYKSGIISEMLDRLSDILSENGIVVFENERPFAGVAQGLYLYDVRRYGRAVFSFFKKRKAGGAFYAGSFDPVTVGHERSVLQALKAFGGVTVILGDNPKKTALFTQEERFSLLKSTFADKNIEVIKFADFASEQEYADYLKSKNALYFIRGIRNEEDFIYEKKAEKRNLSEYPDFVTAYIFCEEEFKKYSSTAVRSAIKKGKSADEFIPLNARENFLKIIKTRS